MNLRARVVEVNYTCLVQSRKKLAEDFRDGLWSGFLPHNGLQLYGVRSFWPIQIGNENLLGSIEIISTDGAQEIQKGADKKT
jgi:hypothetical protein